MGSEMYGYRETEIQTPVALVVPLNPLADEFDTDHLVVNKEVALFRVWV